MQFLKKLERNENIIPTKYWFSCLISNYTWMFGFWKCCMRCCGASSIRLANGTCHLPRVDLPMLFIWYEQKIHSLTAHGKRQFSSLTVDWHNWIIAVFLAEQRENHVHIQLSLWASTLASKSTKEKSSNSIQFSSIKACLASNGTTSGNVSWHDRTELHTSCIHASILSARFVAFASTQFDVTTNQW